MLTLQELKDRLGASYVEAYDNAAGALADAVAIAESHVVRRYPLPLQTVPGILKAAIVDLARRRFYTTDAPEDVLTAEKRSLEMLGAIALGKIDLPLPPLAPPTPEETTFDGILFESAELRLSTKQTSLLF